MEINIVGEKQFAEEVLSYNGVVVVDFYGTWCMPCKMLAPIVEKVCKEKEIKLAKVDIDENEALVRKFGLMSVPTLKIFKDGVESGTSVGVINEQQLLDLIK